MRGDRLAIEGDDLGGVALEVETEDARVRGVDQSQPDALTAPYRELVRNAAVDGGGVADPAAMAHVVAVAEVLTNLGGLRQPPVVQHPGHLAVHPGRLGLSMIRGP